MAFNSSMEDSTLFSGFKSFIMVQRLFIFSINIHFLMLLILSFLTFI